MSTDYEIVASDYDRRYAQNNYDGLAQAIARFAGDVPCAVLEVGCGTGHWLATLTNAGHAVTGLDPSRGMLSRAPAPPSSRLVLGRAETLPFREASFDRVLMVNTLHHFHDPRRALREARRVLRGAGRLMSVGLDPAAQVESWYIYDYFAGTRARDLERYPPTIALRTWLAEGGFARATSEVVQCFDQRFYAREALAEGRLDKHTTSQLVELSDAAYGRGLAAIAHAASTAEARGDRLRLEARLRLFATYGDL